MPPLIITLSASMTCVVKYICMFAFLGAREHSGGDSREETRCFGL